MLALNNFEIRKEIEKKYLGKQLKEVQNLATEKCETSLEGTGLDLSTWKVHCLWIEKFNIIKLAILPKLLYRFSAISIKMPAAYFADTNKVIIKFMLDIQGTAKNILKKKNEVRELTFPTF